MTDDLVQRLREMGGHPCRADFPIGANLREAANRIEQLEREKAVVSDLWEQQKKIALDYLTDCNKAADHIESQAAEIKRLQRSADSWEADALRYAQNAEYWKAELMEARWLEIREKNDDD